MRRKLAVLAVVVLVITGGAAYRALVVKAAAECLAPKAWGAFRGYAGGSAVFEASDGTVRVANCGGGGIGIREEIHRQ
jgi:hypothetical protein